MAYLIDDHREKDWFKMAYSNAERPGNIYTHGIKVLAQDMKDFYKKGLHKIPAYSQHYVPNPFVHQYDLFVHMWINYYKILSREIDYLRMLESKENNEDYGYQADELEATKKLYGISREDCFFAAAEIRWPTQISETGARTGKLIRDPWSEKRITAISHPEIKYVASFGGGGQGKTTTFTAFNLMMFDHYLFTEKGARCMISTTRKDKLNSVAWPYVMNLNHSSRKGISLYAGKGEIRGEWTIKRPGNKDTAGVFKGLLLGNDLQDTAVVDKLTGSHGHHFIGYALDEAQSTSKAPMDAALNFTLHAVDYRIELAGNFSEDNDTLGANTTPPGGWSSVDENTETWETHTKTGQKIIVLHFNNNNSPGMTDRGSKIFPHLPSKKQLRDKYPTESSRSINNLGYRRFWLGWRVANLNKRVVLTEDFVRDNSATLPLDLINVNCTWFNFDSAQAEIDRSPATIAQSGVDRLTGHIVFGPTKIRKLNKATDSLEYYRKSTSELLRICNEEGIKSGGGIVDYTGRPAHAELLSQANFHVERLVYNKGLPDGVRTDTVTKRVERAIPIPVTIDFKDNPPGKIVYAHEIAETCIDFAAWLLMTYIQAKRIRGINDSLLIGIDSHGMDKEFFCQKYFYKPSVKYGDRIKLGDGTVGVKRKEDFRKEYGFSPDIFDTLLQMAWYAFFVLNIPLTPAEGNANVSKREKFDVFKDLDEINNNSFTIEPQPKSESDEMEIQFEDVGSEWETTSNIPDWFY